MISKSKVKNLAYLRIPVKVSETTFVVDDLKSFNRLISIADRELSLFEGLAYELTELPLSLFKLKLRMRKSFKSSVATKLVIVGCWLFYHYSYMCLVKHMETSREST